MKELLFTIAFLGLIPISISQAFDLSVNEQIQDRPRLNSPPKDPDPGLKATVLRILEAKCNQCHRRRNPFMIFKERNLEKRAREIYRQVFELRRMPKGKAYPLTPKQYALLKNYLLPLQKKQNGTVD